MRKLFDKVNGETWALIDGILETLCYDFPVLYFMFDNKWIEVHPEDYVYDVSAAGDRSLCVLLIFPQASAFHVMGMPLFIDYYSVHEMDEGRIGMAPHQESSKRALKTAK